MLHHWALSLERFFFSICPSLSHLKMQKLLHMSITGSFYRNRLENDSVDFCAFLPPVTPVLLSKLPGSSMNSAWISRIRQCLLLHRIPTMKMHHHRSMLYPETLFLGVMPSRTFYRSHKLVNHWADAAGGAGVSSSHPLYLVRSEKERPAGNLYNTRSKTCFHMRAMLQLHAKTSWCCWE